MIIYNVTITIQEGIQDDWVRWMKHHHIPDVMATGCFTGFKFCRLLGEDDHHDSMTYALQYFCETMEDYETYQEKYAKDLQEEHTERYKDQFVGYRTLLEVIDEDD